MVDTTNSQLKVYDGPALLIGPYTAGSEHGLIDTITDTGATDRCCKIIC